MGKPDDIPVDIWNMTTALVERIFDEEGFFHSNFQVHLARAVASEREACAQTIDILADVLSDEIADATKPLSRQILSTQRHAVQTAAAAIRRRSE